MEKTENIQEQTTATEQETRTFTQDDVNKIINKKYAEWASRTADYDELKEKASKFDEIEEANKSELQKANEKADALQKQLDALNRQNEIRSIREKVSTETGVPIALLNADTEEECRNLANGIVAFKGTATYPSVKDGGEAQVSSMTREEILAIPNDKARLKAIQEHIELF